MKLFLINRKKIKVCFLNHINNISTSAKANDKMDRFINRPRTTCRQWESLDIQVCSTK